MVETIAVIELLGERLIHSCARTLRCFRHQVTVQVHGRGDGLMAQTSEIGTPGAGARQAWRRRFAWD
jgi:hypothetical protein